jgi:LuxR family transcriptional regulator, maltose regulon positive regulatory protein
MNPTLLVAAVRRFMREANKVDNRPKAMQTAYDNTTCGKQESIPTSWCEMAEKRRTDGEESISQRSENVEEPLLNTKLVIPRLIRGTISRPHLVKSINEGTNRSLTLISAPPGFGKSTVLAEWAAQSALPVAWLSLDSADNNSPRFLSYLLAAINSVTHLPATPALALMGTSQLQRPHAIAAALVSSLEMLPQPVVLVLDDYHVLSEPSPDAILAFLLDHLPPQLRLIIATRADPPIPLARLRAQGEMLELRADDLRFRPDETSLFLTKVMGLDLGIDDIAALAARTEGWIAGLQMAALSMQGRDDPSNFVRSFSGTHRFILDYLLEEVVSRQPTEVKRFLLRTSILEHLTGPLCAAVVGAEEREKQDSQEILDHLERSNLFVTPLDDERRWYRYHQLFADLLRARLQQTEPGLMPQLHLRAAAWYEQNGFIIEAVRHALTAQDHGRAADLIETYGHKRWSLSDIDFLSLVGKLPPTVLHVRPILGIYHAWSLFTSGQHEAAATLLRALVERIPSDSHSREARGMRNFVHLLLLYIAEVSGEEPADALPDRAALEFVPEHHLGMRNSADVLYAHLLDWRGDFAASEGLLFDAARRDMAAGGVTAVPICISRLARNWVLQGRLRAAAELCRRHIDYVRERGETRFFIAGNLFLALSGILREWNDLEEADQMVQVGLQANEPWQLPQVHLVGHLAKARQQQALGDVDEALATLDRLQPLIQGKSLAPDLLSDLRSLRVKLWLAKGNQEKAWKHLGLSRPVEPLDFRGELDHLLLARLLLSEGKPREALSLLQRLAPLASSGGRFGRLVEIQLLEALALADLGRAAEALQTLESCLSLAEPERYRRVFLDEGKPVRRLLTAYLQHPTSPHASYAGQLLRAFAPAGAAPRDAPETLVEPLSKRELEVLGLMSAGDSNRDVAQKLFITVSAVKKHTSSIYGKLGVSSRTQAIARARRLALLPPEH